MSGDRLVSRRELAQLLGRSPETILVWQREGLINPREYVGPRRLALFSLADAQAVLTRKRAGTVANHASLTRRTADRPATPSASVRRQRPIDTQHATRTAPAPEPSPPPDTLVSAYEQAAQLCRDYLEADADPDYIAGELDLSLEQVHAIAASRRRRGDR